MPTTLPLSRITTDPTWASFMRPAQVATELVGFAVTTGRLMMSSTEGALVVVFAMSLILPDDGYPGYGDVRGSSRTTCPEVASINFIGLCAPLTPRAAPGGMRMVKRPMSAPSTPAPSRRLQLHR